MKITALLPVHRNLFTGVFIEDDRKRDFVSG